MCHLELGQIKAAEKRLLSVFERLREKMGRVGI